MNTLELIKRLSELSEEMETEPESFHAATFRELQKVWDELRNPPHSDHFKDEKSRWNELLTRVQHFAEHKCGMNDYGGTNIGSARSAIATLQTGTRM